jgi:hypothetical protein
MGKLNSKISKKKKKGDGEEVRYVSRGSQMWL